MSGRFVRREGDPGKCAVSTLTADYQASFVEQGHLRRCDTHGCMAIAGILVRGMVGEVDADLRPVAADNCVQLPEQLVTTNQLVTQVPEQQG
jgi:hypothetical protein